MDVGRRNEGHIETKVIKEWLYARGRKIEGVVNGYVLEA